MSQVLRYLGDLGGSMAGKEKKDMKEEPIDDDGEGTGVATPVQAVQAVLEDVKKVIGGKKKKKSKGK